jgi:hypothetical protein
LKLKFEKLPGFQNFKCQIWKITKFGKLPNFWNFESEESLNFKFEITKTSNWTTEKSVKTPHMVLSELNYEKTAFLKEPKKSMV